nr:unnamed protein product [Callosobruchus analis]
MEEIVNPSAKSTIILPKYSGSKDDYDLSDFLTMRCDFFQLNCHITYRQSHYINKSTRFSRKAAEIWFVIIVLVVVLMFANIKQQIDTDTLNNYLNKKHQGAQEFSFKMTTIEEVADTLIKIKPKGAGVDSIGIDMLTLCCPSILPVITHLINKKPQESELEIRNRGKDVLRLFVEKKAKLIDRIKGLLYHINTSAQNVYALKSAN